MYKIKYFSQIYSIFPVVFRCETDEEYRVQFYFNEQILTINGCQQELCEWSTIKEKFGYWSDNCNFDFC